MWEESGSTVGQSRDWLVETCRLQLVADLRFFGD